MTVILENVHQVIFPARRTRRKVFNKRTRRSKISIREQTSLAKQVNCTPRLDQSAVHYKIKSHFGIATKSNSTVRPRYNDEYVQRVVSIDRSSCSSWRTSNVAGSTRGNKGVEVIFPIRVNLSRRAKNVRTHHNSTEISAYADPPQPVLVRV